MGKSWDWHWNSTTVDAQKKPSVLEIQTHGLNKFLLHVSESGFGLIQSNLMNCGSMRLYTAGFHFTLWLPLPIAWSAVVAHPLFWESPCKQHWKQKIVPISFKWGYICWASGLKWRVEEVGMDWGSCWYSFWIYWERRPAIWSPSTGIPWTKGKSGSHSQTLTFFTGCFIAGLNLKFPAHARERERGRKKNGSNN